MPRTEEEKSIMSPLKVKLGEKDYKIKPLGILKAREWRQKAAEELGPITANLQPTSYQGRMLIAGLPAALAAFPEKMCDLLFAYAPDLPKDTILEEATEEQITVVFEQIWEIAFANFLPQMGAASELLRPAISPASANSSN